MTTDHRRAPRREIIEISKTGRWGHFVYLHRLSCGHVESRKRAATTKVLACAWCLRASEKDTELKALANTKIPRYYESTLIDEELHIEQTRASIAAKFNISQDAVDIKAQDIDGQLVIRSATIYLSSIDVARLSDAR